MMGDDMVILLATNHAMGSEGKRKIEVVEGSGAPSATRQKLECVFINVEKDNTEFDVCQMAKNLGLRGRDSLNRVTKDMHTTKSWNVWEKKDQVQLSPSWRRDRLSFSLHPLRVSCGPRRFGSGVLLLHVAVRACRF